MDIYNCSMQLKLGVMGKNEDIKLDKKQVEEIKHEIIQHIEKYIDLKLKPVFNYFEKKKDFYEMSFL